MRTRPRFVEREQPVFAYSPIEVADWARYSHEFLSFVSDRKSAYCPLRKFALAFSNHINIRLAEITSSSRDVSH